MAKTFNRFHTIVAGILIAPALVLAAENGGAIFDHGSGGIVLLRAA